jgi:AraC family transcriptional activator of pobA
MSISDNPSEAVLSRYWHPADWNTSIHLWRYPAGGFENLEHIHGEFEVCVALESAYRCRVEGQIETVDQGDILVIQPGEPHAGIYELDPAPLGLTVSATQKVLKELLAKMGGSATLNGMPAIPRRIQQPRLLSLAEEMAYEMESKAPGSEAILDSLTTQFLVLMLRSCVPVEAPSPHREVPRQLFAREMVRAIEYMNRCGKRSFNLGSLCAELRTSESRFIQLFRNSAKTSPLAFYNRILVSRARKLLVHSDLSVKEVAYLLEFGNESHFCTLFRAVTGVSPSQFRVSMPSHSRENYTGSSARDRALRYEYDETQVLSD